jgi:hypothetical protein
MYVHDGKRGNKKRETIHTPDLPLSSLVPISMRTTRIPRGMSGGIIKGNSPSYSTLNDKGHAHVHVQCTISPRKYRVLRMWHGI